MVDEEELSKLQNAAAERNLTLSEWVRQALRQAYQRQPRGSIEQKLRSVRVAAEHNYPAPDIEKMLEEIEAGYTGSS